MEKLTFDEFIRSLKQNKDTKHSLLLGAGASVESGIPSAADCIWDWKHDIFLSQNPSLVEQFGNIKVDNVKASIQSWLDNAGTYPALNSDDEYSFYVEKAYPIEDDRRKYFQHLVEKKKPSLGYHLISMLAETGLIKTVWTTNFDGLLIKAAHQYSVVPVEITLESQDRIYRTDTKNELLCITLHGDYKYGELKNTMLELDTQNSIFMNALKHELSLHNLIVIGYSGRDKSLLAAIKDAYLQPGTGRLYWCGYGAVAPVAVENLLNSISSNRRQACYISTDGFDKTLLQMSRHCMNTDTAFLGRIDSLLNSLGSQVTIATTAFQPSRGILKKIVKTNIFPVHFPSTCYQFKIQSSETEKRWDFCKSLIPKDIIAVPCFDYIYAWGTKQSIVDACSDRIIGQIEVVPFTKEMPAKNSSFREMLLRALVAVLGKNGKYPYNKNRIWDTAKVFSFNIDDNQIHAYYGIKFSLFFDSTLTFISFSPSYVFRDDVEYSKEVKKKFADCFTESINNGKPNFYINEYIDEWLKNITNGNPVRSPFPPANNEGVNFAMGINSALIGINTSTNSREIQLPKFIDRKRIILNGIECRDPSLLFYNYGQKKIIEDFHPMRGLINNGPYDCALNNIVLRPSISLGVLCPQADSVQFHHFLNSLNTKHEVNYNREFVINFPNFYDSFKVGLNIPTPQSENWHTINGVKASSIKDSAVNLGKEIIKKLKQLNSSMADVVLIYIPKEFEHLTSYSDENYSYDLHDFVKAYAVQKILQHNL
ncbi:MAG: SIR2 family protein [Bacteroidales bacterium]|jgi:hypothetical protein|nr:SIR2 family protein [Bacteroidales bacterium]